MAAVNYTAKRQTELKPKLAHNEAAELALML